jgi:hypothetical protein
MFPVVESPLSLRRDGPTWPPADESSGTAEQRQFPMSMKGGTVDQRPTGHERGDDGDDHVADRERLADQREAALDDREAGIEAREVARAERTEATRSILAGADERDEQADARDSIADKREMDASLHSFLHDDEYDSGHKARRSSATDRSASKTDRTSSAEDRSELTSDIPTGDAEDG